jgi:hypothetical protein
MAQTSSNGVTMKIIICVIGVAMASLLGGCGQDLPDSSNASESSGALRVVQGCIAEARTCAAAQKGAADAPPCADQLRACFGPLVDRRGGGAPADAGSAPPPPPAADRDHGRAAVRECITTLKTCLASATDPMTCAADARDCIKNAI